jgi:hypothetical protein
MASGLILTSTNAGVNQGKSKKTKVKRKPFAEAN